MKIIKATMLARTKIPTFIDDDLSLFISNFYFNKIMNFRLYVKIDKFSKVMLIMNYIIFYLVLSIKNPFLTNLNFIFLIEGYQKCKKQKEH